MNNLILGIILTLLPLTELRLGLPVALLYAKELALPTIPILILILVLNILLIFILFFFLDFIHHRLMNWGFYNRTFAKILQTFQKKTHKFEHSHKSLGFFALILLVGIPLPLTGAYSGVLLSWLLDLERKKSILAISAGVIIAGLIIYFTTLGAFTLF
ncbi:MAG: small multi-drug export protein [Nanoarchaeota archaeon]|jgi:uncharacterized membrane protein|nr:small multi-drug export protein [Nanoarchaeota archaeon]